MDIQLFFILSTILFSSLVTSSQSLRCHPNDFKALVEINKTYNGFHSGAECCDWYSIECDEKTNRVTELSIFGHDFGGPIPSAVGDLPYLEYLTFRKLTNISGPVPRSITKLKKLRFLRLSWLNLTGQVPDFLSELSNLEFLELNFNHFTGPIPPSFSKFTKLGALRLDRNRLTGSIPDSFAHFTGVIPELYLSHNQLTGTIPRSFENHNFQKIDLSRNKLVGDPSVLFRPNGSEVVVDLSRNLFEFNFSNAKFYKGLISLDLNHNKIYGSIPKEYLGGLNVSYNRLCGEIPNGESLKDSDAWNYVHNKCLCGPPLLPCK